jgi:hypothetical protein
MNAGATGLNAAEIAALFVSVFTIIGMLCTIMFKMGRYGYIIEKSANSIHNINNWRQSIKDNIFIEADAKFANRKETDAKFDSMCDRLEHLEQHRDK